MGSKLLYLEVRIGNYSSNLEYHIQSKGRQLHMKRYNKQMPRELCREVLDGTFGQVSPHRFGKKLDLMMLLHRGIWASCEVFFATTIL